MAQQYLELKKAVRLFRTLLNQDVNNLNEIGREFLKVDLNVAKLW